MIRSGVYTQVVLARSLPEYRKPVKNVEIVYGFVLIAITFIIVSIYYFVNYETGCEGAEKMIMPFSCSHKNHDAKCCVDAREMAKIDSPKWQNNCGCDFDEMAEDSDCVDEVMPGTERLEEELTKKFEHMNITFSKRYDQYVCGPDMPQVYKTRRAIDIVVESRLGMEKRLAEEKFIYAYLTSIIGKTPCNTGIEQVIRWDKYNNMTPKWNASLITSRALHINKYNAHITIILNTCGSKNWGIDPRSVSL